MRKTRLVLFATTLLMVGCEDGPERLFTPFEGDPRAQNGYEEQTEDWVQDGEASFSNEGGGDKVGRAKFCDESELTELVQEMIVQPIIPDVSAGSVPLWGADGGPLHADDLVGLRSDGKFCDPPGVYADAFTWGPTDEVIVFFDIETRLVDGIIAYQQYLGTMQGEYTDAQGTKHEIVVKPRERMTIDGRELDRYATRADAVDQPNAWLNPVNVTALYSMVRETFFGADPVPDGYNCIDEALCDIIFTGSNESIPQDTFILLQDSGIQIRFTPEGQAIFVYIQPVRSAPFENGADIAFGMNGGTEMNFGFQSTLRGNCSLPINDEEINWAEFKSRCIATGDERALERVNYNVYTARDAVAVEFNGIDLHFQRNTATQPVLRDGERPLDEDKLVTLAFTRTMPAALQEFRPITIGNEYKARLEQRLKDSIIASGPITPEMHPFWNYVVDVPFTADEPQRVGSFLLPDGSSWVDKVVADIELAYEGLTQDEKNMLTPEVLDHVYLIEPFVDATLFVFTYGASESVDAFKVFRTTDDRRWSIGYAHFIQNGVNFRLNVQYSLNFGAVTYIEVSRGLSETDRLIGFAHASSGGGRPYFQIEQALNPNHMLGIGASELKVRGFDRQLETLKIVLEEAVGPDYEITVSGDPIEDLNGYTKQIRGERYEFVPADVVRLFGRETILVAYIREDGTIGQIEQRLYKGSLELCDGLNIGYGEDVIAKLSAYESSITPNEYRECEIVFNYSENGNVLNSITSISNRRSVSVVSGRATTAFIWE